MLYIESKFFLKFHYKLSKSDAFSALQTVIIGQYIIFSWIGRCGRARKNAQLCIWIGGFRASVVCMICTIILIAFCFCLKTCLGFCVDGVFVMMQMVLQLGRVWVDSFDPSNSFIDGDESLLLDCCLQLNILLFYLHFCGLSC